MPKYHLAISAGISPFFESRSDNDKNIRMFLLRDEFWIENLLGSL